MKKIKLNKTAKNPIPNEVREPAEKYGLSAAEKADIDKFVKDLLKRRRPLFKKLAHA